MTNHDNPYSYPHGMVYSGSQSAEAKVARPLCKYEDSTSGTKRKSDSVQYEKKKDKQKRKKKVHKICLMKDVPSMPREEEYVSCMVPRSSSAATRDATTKPRKEEYVSCMVPRSNSEATDFPNNLHCIK